MKQDSYIAASLLKELGARESLAYLITKIQTHCKNLKLTETINKSIGRIKQLSNNQITGFSLAKKSS